jgi:hypothetical protein
VLLALLNFEWHASSLYSHTIKKNFDVPLLNGLLNSK